MGLTLKVGLHKVELLEQQRSEHYVLMQEQQKERKEKQEAIEQRQHERGMTGILSQ